MLDAGNEIVGYPFADDLERQCLSLGAAVEAHDMESIARFHDSNLTRLHPLQSHLEFRHRLPARDLAEIPAIRR